jgi:hypothetical protein
MESKPSCKEKPNAHKAMAPRSEADATVARGSGASSAAGAATSVGPPDAVVANSVLISFVALSAGTLLYFSPRFALGLFPGGEGANSPWSGMTASWIMSIAIIYILVVADDAAPKSFYARAAWMRIIWATCR